MDEEILELRAKLLAIPDFEQRFSSIIRKAIDYVIDAENTGRTSLSQASKPEKTIFGTKIETYAQIEFGWPSDQKLDFKIDGIAFDAKATVGNTWMIPTEAFDAICLLIRISEALGTFEVGLLRALGTNLTKGANKDQKKSVSAGGKSNILWLIHNMDIPN